jgi:hypothetical protein
LADSRTSMDPLSITVSALSAAKICASVGWELKKFVDEYKVVDSTINGLHQDVKDLSATLDVLNSTLKDRTIKDSASSSTFIGSHWGHMTISLKNADTILCSIQYTVERVDKSARVLDTARKLMRINSSAKEFMRYRERIQSFQNVINICMQSAIL